MRRVLAAASLAFATSLLPAQAVPSPDTPSLSKTFQSSLPAHPRLLFRKEQIPDLEKKADSCPELRLVRDSILTEANATLTKPPLKRIMDGRRLLQVSRDCLHRVTTLALAWQLTGDKRYSRRAADEMLNVAAFSDWNPSHFLDVAEMTAALGLGYDWLYDVLDPEDRQKIREAIVQKGLNPSFAGNSSWARGTNNWNQVCNGGLTLGALAIAEDEPELAAKIVARAVEGLPFVLKGYAPDGVYPEGPVYWNYGTTFNVLFLAAIESALGTDFGLGRARGFLESATFMRHVTGPTGLFHNFSDCGEGGEVAPALFWFASKTNDPSVASLQRARITDGPGKTGAGRARFFPFLLLWLTPAAQNSAPKLLDWVGQGPNPVAYFRSDWSPDAAFAGIKAGSPSENHGHMDAGSFVFDALGERWVRDLGAQGYTDIEKRGINLWSMKQKSPRWSIFRLSNLGHSTLVIDGALQNVAGHASLSARSLQAGSPAATVDCSPIYSGQAAKAMRTFTFRDRKSLLIEDAITSVSKSGTVRWQIITQSDVAIEGGDAILRKNGKSVRVRKLSPAGSWKIVDVSKPPMDFDGPNPGTRLLALDVPVQAGDSPKIAVELIPLPKTNN